MDAATIGKFLEITGPWGLVGILLFLQWRREERESKSSREALGALTKAIDDLTALLTNHDRRAEEMARDVAVLAGVSK